MNLRVQMDATGIDWNQVSALLQKVNMASYSAELHQKAFENSFVVAFIFDAERLVAFARAISDGAYQAAIYDVAVDPDHQGMGLGKRMIQAIKEQCQGCQCMLYASPGKELFYEKEGFRKMKTGMALFTDPEKMKARGFID